MCYHTATPGKKELQKAIKGKDVLYDQPEIFHVSGFTRPYLPVTLNSNVDEIIPARWKLIPYWVKSEADANKAANTLNAKGEEIFEKASYKNVIGDKRGLLYVNGFFEPHATNGKTNDQNFFVYMPSKKIFTLGITYNIWMNEECKEYPTFSILTTAANDQMADIHNVGKRMPLIVPEESRDAWLFADGRQEIEQLIIPFKGELASHRTTEVTKIRGTDTNVPNIQDAI
ncbi:SOS response-associated peptidase [Sphingobacterium corticibacter]|uniref:Abasic site processing protein n=1 Tax=Sphingobacterium corticibacter TaxID=2171749 RepID=A0A2T8HLE7_9SPHI|nr:SOS response-associated peptidase family protein [Sphingobacterium corticibacter]PVH26281.1 SOS response-associated peptidase [Sphingobacterium corticibacter]